MDNPDWFSIPFEFNQDEEDVIEISDDEVETQESKENSDDGVSPKETIIKSEEFEEENIGEDQGHPARPTGL